MYGINKYSVDDSRETVSEWSVCLPLDVDREVYIKTCFNTGTVSLVNSNAEYQHRVKIGRLAIQLIDFPESSNELGSNVVCLKSPYSGKLYVVDVFTSSKEVYSQQEGQFLFVKTKNGSAVVLIDGDGKINISASGLDDESEINISVNSENGKGKFNLNVNGDTAINNSGQVLIKSPKIFLNASEEPILLGNKTTEFCDSLLDILGHESAGPYPLLNAAKYIELKSRLEELKSKKSFVE